MSTPAAFIAWMAPIAISSLLAMTASNCSAGRQPVGHQVLRLVTLPVGGLLVDDLDDAAIRRGDHVVDVLGALDGGLVGELALHHVDVALAAEQLADLLVSSVPESASFEATKAALRAELVEVGRLAVDVDQRHLGVGGELGHRRGRARCRPG